MITVSTIQSKADLETVFAIRREVFVEEQNVPAEDEYDEFEDTSHHFLALIDGQPVGTARWRRTSKGIKLERFAVRAAARGKGAGKALVQAVLNDVFAQQPEPIESIYLHAQVSAMPLYADFGFVPVGQKFDECGIQHYKMVLPGKRMPGEQMAGPQSAGPQPSGSQSAGPQPLGSQSAGPQQSGSQPSDAR